jgi:sulfate adenylyltransferase
MSSTPTSLPEEDLLFRLLRQLDLVPEASQRATAAALDISLGRLNALLRALTEAGLVRLADRAGADRRSRVAYTLTPRGAAEKARLTDRFLDRKLNEYNALHAELTGMPGRLSPSKNRTTQIMQLPNLAPIPELYVSYESAQKLKHDAGDLPSWDLTPRQVCDLELLMNGGFHPLKGFLTEADYDGVVETMRTADGTLWPMPITLDVSGESFADKVEPGQDIALRDSRGRDPRDPLGHRQVDARQGTARPKRSSAPTTSPIRRSTTCTTRPARSISAAP